MEDARHSKLQTSFCLFNETDSKLKLIVLDNFKDSSPMKLNTVHRAFCTHP
jgi:hypothetical protein